MIAEMKFLVHDAWNWKTQTILIMLPHSNNYRLGKAGGKKKAKMWLLRDSSLDCRISGMAHVLSCMTCKEEGNNLFIVLETKNVGWISISKDYGRIKFHFQAALIGHTSIIKANWK